MENKQKRGNSEEETGESKQSKKGTLSREGRLDFDLDALEHLIERGEECGKPEESLAILRNILNIAEPHGSCHRDWIAEVDESFESVNVISLKGANDKQVVFAICYLESNNCDPSCWCGSDNQISLHWIEGAENRVLVDCTFSEGQGSDDDDADTTIASEFGWNEVKSALGLAPKDQLGLYLTALFYLAEYREEWLHFLSLVDSETEEEEDLMTTFPQKKNGSYLSKHGPSYPFPDKDKYVSKIFQREFCFVHALQNRVTTTACADLSSLQAALSDWKSATFEVMKADWLKKTGVGPDEEDKEDEDFFSLFWRVNAKRICCYPEGSSRDSGKATEDFVRFLARLSPK